MSDPDISILPATLADVPTILAFIQMLADYEKMPEAVKATEETLTATLFGDRPYAEVRIARYRGEPAGFALFFHNYSTWLAKPGIYLEDLFVKPELRGKGIGKALLVELAKIAKFRGCGRLEWSVLDWNEPSIQFYKSLGAKPMDEWTTYRMDEDGIAKLADNN